MDEIFGGNGYHDPDIYDYYDAETDTWEDWHQIGNGSYDYDTIADAFEGDPDATWNVD